MRVWMNDDERHVLGLFSFDAASPQGTRAGCRLCSQLRKAAPGHVDVVQQPHVEAPSPSPRKKLRASGRSD